MAQSLAASLGACSDRAVRLVPGNRNDKIIGYHEESTAAAFKDNLSAECLFSKMFSWGEVNVSTSSAYSLKFCSSEGQELDRKGRRE